MPSMLLWAFQGQSAELHHQMNYEALKIAHLSPEMLYPRSGNTNIYITPKAYNYLSV